MLIRWLWSDQLKSFMRNRCVLFCFPNENNFHFHFRTPDPLAEMIPVTLAVRKNGNRSGPWMFTAQLLREKVTTIIDKIGGLNCKILIVGYFKYCGYRSVDTYDLEAIFFITFYKSPQTTKWEHFTTMSFTSSLSISWKNFVMWLFECGVECNPIKSFCNVIRCHPVPEVKCTCCRKNLPVSILKMNLSTFIFLCECFRTLKEFQLRRLQSDKYQYNMNMWCLSWFDFSTTWYMRNPYWVKWNVHISERK